MLFFFIGALLHPLVGLAKTTAPASRALNSPMQSITDRLNLNTGSNSNKCSDDSCPELLKKWLKDSKQLGLQASGSAPSPYKACHRQPSLKAPIKTPAELVRFYENNTSIKIGNHNALLMSTCFSDSANDLEAQTLMINKYYNSFYKLEGTSQVYLHEIASIDNLLGQPALNHINCNNDTFSRNKKTCSSIKKTCAKTTRQWPEFVKSSREKYTQYKNAKNSLKQADAAFTKESRKFNPNNKTLKKLSKNKKLLFDHIKGLESQNPWITGDTFKKNVKNNFQQALKKQLNSSRKQLAKQYSSTVKTMQCISKPSHSRKSRRTCKLPSMTKALEKVPDYVAPKISGSKAEIAHVNNQLEEINCIDDLRVQRDRDNEEAANLTSTIVLTALSFGLPAVVARGVAMTRSGAKATMGVIDGFYASQSAINASTVCANKHIKPESHKDKFTCSVYKSKQIENYDECFNATLFIALDAMPFVPLGLFNKTSKTFSKQQVRKNSLLNDQQRKAKAGRLLGRLTPDEKTAIIEAHNVGTLEGRGVFNFTLDDKKKKLDILKKAGFSKAERKLLMRSGITGGPSSEDLQLEFLDFAYFDNDVDSLISLFIDEDTVRGIENTIEQGVDLNKVQRRAISNAMQINTGKLRKHLSPQEYSELVDSLSRINDTGSRIEYLDLLGRVADNKEQRTMLMSQQAETTNLLKERAAIFHNSKNDLKSKELFDDYIVKCRLAKNSSCDSEKIEGLLTKINWNQMLSHTKNKKEMQSRLNQSLENLSQCLGHSNPCQQLEVPAFGESELTDALKQYEQRISTSKDNKFDASTKDIIALQQLKDDLKILKIAIFTDNKRALDTTEQARVRINQYFGDDGSKKGLTKGFVRQEQIINALLKEKGFFVIPNPTSAEDAIFTALSGKKSAKSKRELMAKEGVSKVKDPDLAIYYKGNVRIYDIYSPLSKSNSDTIFTGIQAKMTKEALSGKTHVQSKRIIVNLSDKSPGTIEKTITDLQTQLQAFDSSGEYEVVVNKGTPHNLQMLQIHPITAQRNSPFVLHSK